MHQGCVGVLGCSFLDGGINYFLCTVDTVVKCNQCYCLPALFPLWQVKIPAVQKPFSQFFTPFHTAFFLSLPLLDSTLSSLSLLYSSSLFFLYFFPPSYLLSVFSLMNFTVRIVDTRSGFWGWFQFLNQGPVKMMHFTWTDVMDEHGEKQQITEPVLWTCRLWGEYVIPTQHLKYVCNPRLWTPLHVIYYKTYKNEKGHDVSVYNTCFTKISFFCHHFHM